MSNPTSTWMETLLDLKRHLADPEVRPAIIYQLLILINNHTHAHTKEPPTDFNKWDQAIPPALPPALPPAGQGTPRPPLRSTPTPPTHHNTLSGLKSQLKEILYSHHTLKSYEADFINQVTVTYPDSSLSEKQERWANALIIKYPLEEIVEEEDDELPF